MIQDVAFERWQITVETGETIPTHSIGLLCPFTLTPLLNGADHSAKPWINTPGIATRSRN